MPTQHEEMLKRFDELIKNLNTKHEYCNAHSEGKFCHLDDSLDNEENITPELKAFLISEIDLAIAKDREKDGRNINTYVSESQGEWCKACGAWKQYGITDNHYCTGYKVTC